MKYKSTRGGVSGLSFQEALLSGFAADGGLCVPESLPCFSQKDFEAMGGLSYLQLIEKLLPCFVSAEELTPQEIHELLDGCFAQFDDPRVIPITKVGPVSVAELWHGPTGAFKDLALTVVARLIDHFLKKDGERATLVVATTGDTGSAAIHSVLGRKNVKIIALFTRERISRTQQLQMTTIDAPNVTVCSCDGICEDIDAIIMKLFSDSAFVKTHNLTSVNSINVGRVILQAVHYIYIYLQLIPKADKSLVFSIPSGGLGHLTGGIFAKRMGLPIKFLSTVNENDCVHRVFSTGVLSISSVVPTYANSMDVGIAYNIERVLYFMSGQNGPLVKAIFEEFERDTRCVLPPELLSKNDCVSTTRVTMEELISTMKQVWTAYNYLLCPHTAIAMHASLKHLKENSDSTDIVVLATATAAKFPEVVQKAGLSLPSPLPPSVARLEGRAEHNVLKMEKGEDWEAILRNTIEILSLNVH